MHILTLPPPPPPPRARQGERKSNMMRKEALPHLALVLLAAAAGSAGAGAFLPPAAPYRAAGRAAGPAPALALAAGPAGASGAGGDGGDGVSDEVLASLAEKLEASASSSSSDEKKKQDETKDNKAMAFLKSIGRVGGAANKDFVNAIGSDEGSSGRQPAAKGGTDGDGGGGGTGGRGGMRKARSAYSECTKSGTVDDLSEPFPATSSGREWRGVSDRVVGGTSDGRVVRDPDLGGRPANVLAGRVRRQRGGRAEGEEGFLQMVTDLPLDPSSSAVDASDYDGIALEVLCRHDPPTFGVHVRTPGTLQQASYRYRHRMDEDQVGEWNTVLIPFSSFVEYTRGCGEDGDDAGPATAKGIEFVADAAPAAAAGYGDGDGDGDGDGEEECEVLMLDPSALKRIGIVAIGDEMDVFLAISKVEFYSVF